MTHERHNELFLRYLVDERFRGTGRLSIWLQGRNFLSVRRTSFSFGTGVPLSLVSMSGSRRDPDCLSPVTKTRDCGKILGVRIGPLGRCYRQLTGPDNDRISVRRGEPQIDETVEGRPLYGEWLLSQFLVNRSMNCCWVSWEIRWKKFRYSFFLFNLILKVTSIMQEVCRCSIDLGMLVVVLFFYTNRSVLYFCALFHLSERNQVYRFILVFVRSLGQDWGSGRSKMIQ